MGNRTWRWFAVVGLLASTLGACATEKRAQTKQPTAAAQPRAQPGQQAVPPAPRPQEELAGAQARLEKAHQDVAQAQQRLAEAQQREERERASVQQLELKARRDLDRASQLALQAEQAQGLQAATGRIAQATPTRVLLQLRDGRVVSFNVDQRTRVLVGSEQRSVADIQQGADARVAYDPKGAEPTAITIRVAPVGPELGAPPQSPPSPLEGAPPPQR
jgi:hypothetical protein